MHARFECGCCGEERPGFAMADGDDVGVQVCPRCDGRHGRMAYAVAVLRRTEPGLKPERARAVAARLGESEQRALLEAAAVQVAALRRDGACRGSGQRFGDALTAVGLGVCRACRETVKLDAAGRAGVHPARRPS